MFFRLNGCVVRIFMKFISVWVVCLVLCVRFGWLDIVLWMMFLNDLGLCLLIFVM